MADITTVYRGFRGVDFRGDEVNLSRSPDSLNMWKDYREIDSIRTRPALTLKHKFENTVWGIFFYKIRDIEYTFVHSGTKLYRGNASGYTEVYSGLNERPSNAFVYNDVWYFMDGKNYLCYRKNKVEEVEGYIPTTSISKSAESGGKTHEDVNLLTGVRKNTFLGDKKGTIFWLDAQQIDENYKVTVTVNNIERDNYVVDYKGGKITFLSPPPEPTTTGADNIVVTFRKSSDAKRDMIEKCTLVQMFDNRIFVSGNPDYPNKIWHCSLNDQTYFSDLDYYNEGLD